MQEILEQRSESAKIYRLNSRERRIIVRTAPLHYRNGEDKWADIKLNFESSPGMYLANYNKVTCGLRTDKVLEKAIGLRYDQDIQFEISFRRIEINGTELLSKSEEVCKSLLIRNGVLIHRLNSVDIISQYERDRYSNYVLSRIPVESVIIEEELHLKGLTCSNLQNAEGEFIPGIEGEFNFIGIVDQERKFWIPMPHIKTARGIQLRGFMQHSLKLVNGSYIYTKTSDPTRAIELRALGANLLIDSTTYYGHLNDGYITSLSTTSWAAAYAGEGLSTETNSAAATACIYVQYDTGFPKYEIRRTVCFFNTLAIPSNATILSASFGFRGYSSNQAEVKLSEGTAGTSLTTADWTAFSTLYETFSPWSIASYNIHDLASSNFGDIQKDGSASYTNVMLQSEYDTPSTPASENIWTNGMYFSENTGTAQDPYVTIDYKVGFPAIMMVN